MVEDSGLDVWDDPRLANLIQVNWELRQENDRLNRALSEIVDRLGDDDNAKIRDVLFGVVHGRYAANIDMKLRAHIGAEQQHEAYWIADRLAGAVEEMLRSGELGERASIATGRVTDVDVEYRVEVVDVDAGKVGPLVDTLLERSGGGDVTGGDGDSVDGGGVTGGDDVTGGGGDDA